MLSGISALEHEVLAVAEQPGTFALSSAEADRLGVVAQLRPGFCARGYRSVRLANYAGLINLGGRVLEVLPKVEQVGASVETCRGVLLRLLRLAEGLRLHVDQEAAHGLRGGPLLEVFIAAFFDEVARLLRGGLLRRYQTREEDLPLIRGRLQLQRQISAHGLRPDRLACRFDELTADNDWNRVLKAALAICKPWLETLALRRRWMELWPAFDEVSDVQRVGEVFERLSPDRQVVRYAPSVTWARWIVSALTPNLRAGTSAAPGLLFDTNRLFELAVARKLKSVAARSESSLRVRSQVAEKHLAATMGADVRLVGLRPDLVLEEQGRVVAVADTKWKRVGVRSGYLEPDPQDLHQMLAYAAAFKCGRLALIYPWHEGLAGARETVLELPLVGGVQPRVEMICVDVGADELPARGVQADGYLASLLV